MTIERSEALAGEWILTYTGRQFWPLAPRAEDICIEDIAHALSLICRFCGHVREFYSVAQHSVLVSMFVNSKYALEALLHDASEAYMADVSRPIKHSAEFAPYRVAEDRLQAVIRDAFGLHGEELGGVKAADRQLLMTERRDLMHPNHWEIDRVDAELCLKNKIVPIPPAAAERLFLDRFEALVVGGC